jgi:hypothetical protein
MLALQDAVKPDGSVDWQAVASPEHVALQERFVNSMAQPPPLSSCPVVVGPPLDRFADSGLALEASVRRARKFSDAHLINMAPDGSRVLLVFLVDATPAQVLSGFLHAWLASNQRRDEDLDAVREWMERTDAPAKLVQSLEAQGWQCQHVFIEPKRSRVKLCA